MRMTTPTKKPKMMTGIWPATPGTATHDPAEEQP